MNISVKPFVFTLGLLLSAGANAHGGEDHGDEGKAAPVPTAAAARALARSEDFELVAVLEDGAPQGRRLRIYLDRFTSNAPVTGAKLEVEGGGQSVVATEAAAGVYVARLDALAGTAPGAKLPLTIAIEAGEAADLLTATLEIPAPEAGSVVRTRSLGVTTAWLIGAALGVAAIVLLILRRRQHRHHLKKGVD